MLESLKTMGHQVVECQIPFTDYEADMEFANESERLFIEKECEIFLSFDFFPMIAKLAEKRKKKYISWVYDTPHKTLCSPSVRGEEMVLFDS